MKVRLTGANWPRSIRGQAVWVEAEDEEPGWYSISSNDPVISGLEVYVGDGDGGGWDGEIIGTRLSETPRTLERDLGGLTDWLNDLAARVAELENKENA